MYTYLQKAWNNIMHHGIYNKPNKMYKYIIMFERVSNAFNFKREIFVQVTRMLKHHREGARFQGHL